MARALRCSSVDAVFVAAVDDRDRLDRRAEGHPVLHRGRHHRHGRACHRQALTGGRRHRQTRRDAVPRQIRQDAVLRCHQDAATTSAADLATDRSALRVDSKPAKLGVLRLEEAESGVQTRSEGGHPEAAESGVRSNS